MAKMAHFHLLIGMLLAMVFFVAIHLIRLVVSHREIDILDTVWGAITVGTTYYVVGILLTRVFFR